MSLKVNRAYKIQITNIVDQVNVGHRPHEKIRLRIDRQLIVLTGWKLGESKITEWIRTRIDWGDK